MSRFCKFGKLHVTKGKGIDDMKNKNTIIITEEMINSDPYGYTYKEICDCVGEKKLDRLCMPFIRKSPKRNIKQ